jgi:hypothetical protein
MQKWSVRTTVTLEDHLFVEAKVAAARAHMSFGALVEEALRSYLLRSAHRGAQPARSIPVAHSGGIRPGVDLDDSSMMLDMLDDERTLHEMR